jgi:hypothetical protein
MNRRTVLGVALAATIIVGACSAATVPSAAPTSPAPAVAVAAPSVASPSPAPATASQPLTIHVLEDPLNWATVKLGTLTGCPETMGDYGGCLGDYVVGRSSMRDAATNKTVGFLVTECFVVDAASGRVHCPATTITLTGRGQVVFTENVLLGPHICPTCGFTPDADPSSGGYAVTGGSGELLGATVADSPGSTYAYGDWVITLTR